MRTSWRVILAMAIALTGQTHVHGAAKVQSVSQSTPAPAGPNASSSKEKTFLTHAAQGGEAEIELGRMAQQKAADAKVKEFGARMQKDHGNANAELRAIIVKKGLVVPGGPGPHLALRNRLDKLQGATFDQAYMKAMADDHAAAVTEFEIASKSADSDIRAFAAKTLPTLREHKQMADSVLKSVSSSIRSSSETPTPGARQGGASGTKPGDGTTTAPAPGNADPTGRTGAPR